MSAEAILLSRLLPHVCYGHKTLCVTQEGGAITFVSFVAEIFLELSMIILTLLGIILGQMMEFCKTLIAAALLPK